MSELPIETPPLPFWRRRGTQIAAGVTLVVLLVAGWYWHRSGAASESAAEPVVSVRVAQAEVAPIAQPLDLVGTIVARQEATISPKVSGQIAQIAPLKNRAVRPGEILAVLEARDLNAQRNEAAAALAEAEAALTGTGQGTIPLTVAQDQKPVHDPQAPLNHPRLPSDLRPTLPSARGLS